MSNIYAELASAAGAERGSEEPRQEYLIRLTEALAGISDDAFGRLSAAARDWFNAAAETINAGSLAKIPELIGLPNNSTDAVTATAPQQETQSMEATPAATDKKTTKKAKPTQKPKAPASARNGAFPEEAKITLLIKDNPKRPGSRAHKMYPKYGTCSTVGAYLKAGGKRSDLRWDVEKKFISVK